MRRGALFKKLVYSPWLLAALPAVVIMLFLPPLGLHYTLNIEEKGKLFSNETYVDLNADSVTEIVRLGKGFPYYHLLILDNNYRIYDQLNFKDSLDAALSFPFFGNIDNDNFKEIYIFSYKNDSLFLNINEFFDSEGIRMEGQFISKMKPVNNTVTSNVYPAGFYDVSGDGNKELYFTIATGFGLEPRLVYYFDVFTKVLKSSQFLGVNCQFPRFSDADGDNKPEIFGRMSASGNYKVPTPFTDMSTWLMVFDEELNLEFTPDEFPGLTNNLEIYPYSSGDFKGFIMSHNTATADTSVSEPRLLIYSGDGNFVKEKVYSKLGLDGFVALHLVTSGQGDRIFLFEKEVIELNDRLEVVNKIKSPLNQVYFSYVEDIDLNGIKEIILFSAGEEKLIVLNTSLHILAEANLKSSASELKFSHSISSGNRNKLFVTSSDNSWLIEMKNNNLFYLGYLAYPGIYMLLVLFIDGINRINTYKIRQKESLKQRLLTLQLQGIKSQLDPHFTFNALNSIASLIYLDDRQSAYDNMNKFTMLLRSMLNDADRIYRSLGEELDFVTTYLELEKLRFGDKFNFIIEISDEVSQKEQVPKLVLQTFAENAIKHGLMPCTEGGILKIVAAREDNYLKLTIEDNGVGREKTSGKSTSTGKGLKLTGEFYDILNQLNKQAIIHTLTDLYDANGLPAGTRVDVWVPLNV